MSFLARTTRPTRLLASRALNPYAPTRLIRPRGLATSQTTQKAPRFNPIITHLLAGLAGGSIVIGAGYTYYHFSGIKQAIVLAKHAKQFLFQTRESVLERHPNEALEFLRKAAKSYAALVPGSGIVIDRIFNSVETIVEEHQEEASEILLQALVKVHEIVKKKNEMDNVELSAKVMEVVGVHLALLGALGAKAGEIRLDVGMDQAKEKWKGLAEKIKFPGGNKSKDEPETKNDK
ncbi:hypothetical protein VNI00_011988 [Paramarasmius palmivorus]|uniref:Uncharacterized protein n=1 Tax=Paramarasmius palmivorus TaxID=297713 RepID=A0AAW0C887_9AGAR